MGVSAGTPSGGPILSFQAQKFSNELHIDYPTDFMISKDYW